MKVTLFYVSLVLIGFERRRKIGPRGPFGAVGNGSKIRKIRVLHFAYKTSVKFTIRSRVGGPKGVFCLVFICFNRFCATSKFGLLRSVRDDKKLTKIGRSKHI